MGNEEKRKLNFFVFVVESPSAVDLYHRRSEGEIIQQAVNLNQIPCIVKMAINKEAFESSLKIGLKDAMDFFKGSIPILHISAHGFSEGIQLSNNEIIEWATLKELLIPINTALKNYLLVCMSSCEGYSGVRMAMTSEKDKPHPFYAIVANGEKPLWADTAVAFSTFYHQIAKGNNIFDAVEAMRVAAGDKSFWIQTAEEAKRGFLEYIKKIDAGEAQEKLEETTASENPEHLAKLEKVSKLQEKPITTRFT